MTTHHYRYNHIPRTEDDAPTPEGVALAEDLILYAMAEDRRHPVTLGFYEQKKEWRKPKRGDGPHAWYVVPGEYVHTVRTIEFFDFDESADGVYFTGMDRCPRSEADWHKHGPPKIRRVAARRITDVTVGKNRYRLKNQYFIDRVREHAEGQRQFTVAGLTDDALWSMIELATDTDDAIAKAGLPARTA